MNAYKYGSLGVVPKLSLTKKIMQFSLKGKLIKELMKQGVGNVVNISCFQ